NALPASLQAVHASLLATDTYDMNYVYRLSDTERTERLAERAIDADRLAFPLTTAMIRRLYPAQPLEANAVLQSASVEEPNVVGDSISLHAGGANGRIGNVQSATYLDMRSGFSALSDTQKALLSSSNVTDIVGVHFDLYRYIGTGETVDLSQPLSGSLSRVTINMRTSTSSQFPVVVTPGMTVLVERADEYGLYEYVGPTSIYALSSVKFANDPTRWRLLSANYDSTDGQVFLNDGDLVADVSEPSFVMLRPVNDVNVRTPLLSAHATNGVYIESDQDLGVTAIESVDVSLTVHGRLFSYQTGVAATGEVSLRADSLSDGFVASDPFTVNLSTTASLRVESPGEVNLWQDPNAQNSELKVLSVNSNSLVKLQVPDGNLHIGWISSPTDVTLETPRGGVTDALQIDFNDSNQVNIFAKNLVINASRNIGADANGLPEPLNVELSGTLTATTPGAANFDSIAPLRVAEINATDVLIHTRDELRIQYIISPFGTVAVYSDSAILNDLPLNVTGRTANIEYHWLNFGADVVGAASHPLQLNGRILRPDLPVMIGEANRGIYLRQDSSAMYVERLRSPAGAIALTATNGLVPTALPGPSDNHLDAPSIEIDAFYIGNAQSPVMIQADRLKTKTSLEQYLSERDTVDAELLDAAGSRVVLAGGQFLIGAVNGTVRTDTDATLGGSGQVTGDVDLNGGVLTPGR
ncbi:MAG: hypothetical protein KDA92_23815, partial [Planctomycetales bacterium]|nr:hypothetical protein [Planctomycetales bacterium]